MSQNGFQETFQSSLRPEGTMDLFIETLTGTAFEMTVSPFDTIMSIKSKIQRVEGIPISHQHLLYNLQELDDSSSLMDHAIRNGATLKLVLSMRGGPISTRRIHTGEELTWKELREFMESSREDMLDHIPPGCRVTVLVFRDGDQVNLFRVIENEDGTYSPLSESLSSSSIQSLFADEDPEESAKRLQENSVTMCKMQELRNRMEALALRRKPKKSAPRVLSAKRPLLHSRKSSVRTAVAHPPKSPDTLEAHRSKVQSEFLHLPPIRKAQASVAPSRQRAVPGGYLNSSSLLSHHLTRRTRDSDRSTARLDTCAPRQLLKVPKKEPKEVLLPRRPPMVSTLPSKRPGGRRGSRLLAPQPLDMKPTQCTEFTSNRNIYRPAEAPPEPKTTPENPKSTGILSTSKIAIVEQESDSTLDKVEPDLVPAQNSIPVPIPSNEATTFTVSPLTRERMSTSVGSGGRYRVSRLLLDDDRPKTSPDKLTQQQKQAQEICDLLSETKWHRRQHQVHCSSIDQLSSSIPVERMHRNLTRRDPDKATHMNLGMRYPSSLLDVPVPLAPTPARYGRRSLLLPISKAGRDPEADYDPRPSRGARRRMPSGSHKTEADVLPLLSSLPPPLPPPPGPAKKTVRQRCAQCRKRLNITNVYTCRCEKLFCAAHRYSELHNCSFDYKTEGRKLLEQANPLVMAPKLPKI